MTAEKARFGFTMQFRSGRNGTPAISYVPAGYYDLLIKAGAVPIAVPPLTNEEDINCVLDMLDGMVLVGGGDLDPRFDGYWLHPSLRLMDRRREEFDRMLIRSLAARRLPTFALGSAIGLLNVSQGGNLMYYLPEDVPQAMPHADPTDPFHRHAISVAKGSLLYRVYRDNTDIRVTSQHTTAVDEVAAGFTVTARAPDEVIEAIESTTDWLALGIQWQAESPAATALDHCIFEEFVARAMADKKRTRRVA